MGSLFSGIGGLELGLEAALGAETIWQVENNPYARAVLERHWPNVRRYEDVGAVGRHTLEPVELILGGFPCQGASAAGKRKGLEDERSGLWFEYARIIRELEPRWVVIENVPGLSSRGLDQVLGSLATLRYDAVWECLSAAAVGAPHIRDRLFIIAWKEMANAHGEGELQEGGSEREERRRAGNSGEEANVADAHLTGLEEREGERRSFPPELSSALRACGEGRAQWLVEPELGRVAHGVRNRVDRLRCLGNAVVPQCSYVIGMWLLQIKQWLEEQ